MSVRGQCKLLTVTVDTPVCPGSAGTHLLKAARPLSDCSGVNTSCRNVMPVLYMSKRSGLLSRHNIGDSSAASGRGGALRSVQEGACERNSRTNLHDM